MLDSCQKGAMRSGAAIAAGCLALIAAIWAVTLERVSFERRDAMVDVVRQNSNLTLAFEQQVAATFDRVDAALRFVRDEYKQDGPALDLHARFERGVFDPRVFLYAGIIDSRGTLIETSNASGGADLSGRDYFQFHRNVPADILRIGTPFMSSFSKQFVIHFTRRIDAADGSFAGVAVVAVDPKYLVDFFEHLEVGTDGVLQIVGFNGIALARRVNQETRFAVDMRTSTLQLESAMQPVGNYVSKGVLESAPRYISYRTLKNYPYVVAVGTAVDRTLLKIAAREGAYYTGAAGGTAVVMLFGSGIWLALRRARKASEDKKRTQATYRATVDNAPVGIANADRDGRFLKVNRKLCDMLGYSEAELLARGWNDIVHPEDLPRNRTLIECVIADPAGMPPEVGERCLRKDGSAIWTVASLSLVRESDGRPDYVVTVLRDVTARKLAEEDLQKAQARYRATFEQAAVGIVHASLKNTFLRVNRRFCEMLGYAPEELIGQESSAVTHPDDVHITLDTGRELHEGRYPAHAPEYEKRYIRKDGGTVWARISMSLVRKPDGRPHYFIAMVQDI